MKAEDIFSQMNNTDFQDLLKSFNDYNSTGVLQENAPFRLFHEKLYGKDNFQFVLSQLIIGIEAGKRLEKFYEMQ